MMKLCVSRINTSSATEPAWSTWEALITMQRKSTSNGRKKKAEGTLEKQT